jgi:hypothetical protein
LGVIIGAGQAQGRQAVADATLVLDQPPPGADAHEITALRRRHCSPSPPDAGNVSLRRKIVARA